jgi:DNA-3-methyladenine glycosylase
VEVEAYGGPDDRASHARFTSRGRNLVMAGRAGIAYVYLVYGMYDCLNVVTGPEGTPGAVLIRAVEPLEGTDEMRRARLVVEGRRRAARSAEGLASTEARIGATRVDRLASGPGLVAAAFGIDTRWTGRDLCDPASTLRLERNVEDPADREDDDAVQVTPRIGIDYAGPQWASRPWRFAIAGHPSVSGSRAR